MMQEKINVHIADDHQILIDGIIAVINTDDDIVVEGYSLTGRQVIDWAKENETDVLVLDINMPEVDGIEVMRFFQTRNIQQKTIILSSYDDPKFVQEMLTMGVKGFISKTSAGEHIVKAIKAVAKGEQYFSDEIKSGLLDLMTKQNSVKEEKVIDENSLTDREIDVLKLVVKEHSTPEIAKILNISNYTVETYKKSLRKKTNVKNAVGLAMYAVKNNIV
ncbi:MAG: response regulator [Flavobacteriaceae bacterium]